MYSEKNNYFPPRQTNNNLLFGTERREVTETLNYLAYKR